MATAAEWPYHRASRPASALSQLPRTRIKICGITRLEDASAAAAAGADAVGLVFHQPSARYVSLEQAAAIARALPPFITTVGLFVNAEPRVIENTLAAVPLQLLQFHGDERETDCARYGLPYIKAARVRPELDLVEYAGSFRSARGLLVDAFADGYGGAGQTFDWALIPARLPLPLIVAGGLHAGNVAAAVRALRPWAVDVSTGVESAKGIKDARRMTEFVAGVRDGES